MRFLVREQPYETPFASGRLRYGDGGVVESWRLNGAVDGFVVLRVDVDGRGSQGGDSYLYHLLLDGAGQPERLTYRFWGSNGDKVEGNLFFETSQVICGRTVNGNRVADIAVNRPDPLIHWFPATTGLYCFGTVNAGEYSAIWLDSAQKMGLVAGAVQVALEGEEEIEMMGRPVQTQRKTIGWTDQTRTVWFDEHNWPVMVQDGETIIKETRYIRRL